MQKTIKMPVAIAISGAIGIGALTTMDYIKDIKSDLAIANEQVAKLKEDNLKHTRELDRLTGELTTSLRENTELQDANVELLGEVKSLKAKLEEKVLPTQKSRAIGTPIEMTMTFYGDFAHENGGYAGIDCNGDKLVAGTIASNYYPQGTQFEFNGQIFTVRDRGGSNFNSPNRLDVFVPRLKNESDSAYAKRIRHYGRKTVTMYKR